MKNIMLVNQWLKKANDDYVVAKHTLEDIYPSQIEISCYHAQQCAEKSLKAFLIYCDIEPPRTHNLIVLCQMCLDFETLFESQIENCAHLTPYSVVTRYPNNIEITKNEAEFALKKAKEIYDFAVVESLKEEKLKIYYTVDHSDEKLKYLWEHQLSRNAIWNTVNWGWSTDFYHIFESVCQRSDFIILNTDLQKSDIVKYVVIEIMLTPELQKDSNQLYYWQLNDLSGDVFDGWGTSPESVFGQLKDLVHDLAFKAEAIISEENRKNSEKEK